MLRQFHVVCNSSGCRDIFALPDWRSVCAGAVSIADSGRNSRCVRRLTHRRASLASEAPIARPWISAFGLFDQSTAFRGRGKRRPGSMDRSCRGCHRAVVATAWPAAALLGKVPHHCRPVAVALGVADPPKGGCVGPRALRSCTTPDSPCPARANQRSPDRAGALRWRPGPLKAPPARADRAVPPDAATCGRLHRAH